MTDGRNPMEEAIRKAQTLIEALPYIRAFRGKVFVVKFGGAAMEVPATLESVLGDVLFLGAVGIRPVLVHGGGPEITREMKARKIEPRFVRGHRLTDEATLRIVQDVLANRINAGICKRLAATRRAAGGVREPGAGRAQGAAPADENPDARRPHRGD